MVAALMMTLPVMVVKYVSAVARLQSATTWAYWLMLALALEYLLVLA